MKAWRAKWEMLAMLLCVIIGALSIPYPFHGDQAMFMMAVSKLQSAGILYRDFWDFKQPGIYWFYFSGGKLFGFTEIGVHTLEFVWVLLDSLAILLILRKRVANAWMAPLGAVLFPIWYYGTASDWHRTQVEALVGLPLLICSAVFSNISEGKQFQGWKYLGAGLCAGIVLLFKVVFLPLVLGFVLICSAYEWRVRRRLPPKPLWLFVAGLAVPIAATVIYFYATGAGYEALYANFLYPEDLTREYPPVSYFMRIRGSLLWFLRSFAPLIVLAAAGLILRPRRRNFLLTFQLGYWLAMGLFVIWVQWYSHWGYHFFLLLMPTLMMAVMGLDGWSSKMPGYLKVSGAVSVLLLLSIVPIVTIVHRSVTLAQDDFGLSQQGRSEYYATESTDDYRAVNQDVEFLRESTSLPGELLVLGNPLYYTLSGRLQSGRENGWALDLMLPRNRQRMVADLQAHPAAYVLVAGESETAIVKERFHDLEAVLRTKYEVCKTGPHKVWYRVRQATSN